MSWGRIPRETFFLLCRNCKNLAKLYLHSPYSRLPIFFSSHPLLPNFNANTSRYLHHRCTYSTFDSCSSARPLWSSKSLSSLPSCFEYEQAVSPPRHDHCRASMRERDWVEGREANLATCRSFSGYGGVTFIRVAFSNLDSVRHGGKGLI